MGYGDDIMATGLARGAAARGRRVAFGDGRRIIWGPWSEEMFRYNPNIAPPGQEGARDIEWVDYYKGHRRYNHMEGGRWVWNYKFRAPRGELFFSEHERMVAAAVPAGFILIEPNVPWHKAVAPNKDWGLARYQEVADILREAGHRVAQFDYGRDRLRRVDVIRSRNFREALAVLTRALFVVTPEGGLHHGAAATGAHAVVIFGGFVPSEVTGYEGHVNLTGGARACGSIRPCGHCRQALDRISVGDVLEAAGQFLGGGAT